MGVTLTFLSAARRFTKKFTKSGEPEAYLLQKSMTSHNVTVENLREFYEAVKEYGQQGYALQKGPLTKAIKNESRRGLTDKTAKTRWLVFDIDALDIDVQIQRASLPNEIAKRYESDNIPLQILWRDGVRDPAEAVDWLREQLPELKGVSCFLQYSSSYLISKETFSGHIFFMLDKEYTPRELTAYLGLSNFDGELSNKIRLTPSQQALHFPIDVSVAANSKLIYIAPPICIDIEDPFPGDARYRYIPGHVDFLTLPANKLNYSKFQAAKQNKLKELRKAAGLSTSPKDMPKLVKNQRGELININPGEGTISVVAIGDNVVRCNVNGGDSQAYWFYYGPIRPDTLMHNFKGEEPFPIVAFDPEFAESWNRDHFPDAAADQYRAFVFRDPAANRYFAVEYNPAEDVRAVHPIDIGKPMQDFYANRGMAVPEITEEWSLVFDPTGAWFLDDVNKRVNKFKPSRYLIERSEFPEEIKPDNAAELLKKYAPAHYTLLHHALGSSEEHMLRFINWMACHAQGNHRDSERVDTAWILQGVPGTGKSSIVNDILAGIYNVDSHHYALSKSLKLLNDTHNGWLEIALFVEVEEAYLAGMGKDSNYVLENVIKPMITDKMISVRAMYKDQITSINHAAYIFTTNRVNPVKIQTGDRRFHVGPRQGLPLRAAVENEDLDAFFAKLEEERQVFTDYLFSHYADFNSARITINDEHKQALTAASMSVMEQLGMAVAQSDLYWFYSSLADAEPPSNNVTMRVDYEELCADVDHWVLETAKGRRKPFPVTLTWLRRFYNLLMPDNAYASAQAFNKAFVNQTALNPTKISIPKKGRYNGYLIDWRKSLFPSELVFEEIRRMAEERSGNRKARKIKHVTAQ